jgi:hypothetical protein
VNGHAGIVAPLLAPRHHRPQRRHVAEERALTMTVVTWAWDRFLWMDSMWRRIWEARRHRGLHWHDDEPEE